MSLFKRPGSPNYYYEFEAHGQRHCKSTRTANRRAAEKVEARARAAVEALRQEASGRNRPLQYIQMPLGEAADRFWREKGQHEKGAANVWGQLERLKARLGASTLLSTIGTPELIDYREKRRDDTSARGKLLAARTINADIELYRRMLAYADDSWSKGHTLVDTGPPKTWGRIRLTPPKGRVRELSQEEEKRLFEHLRADYHDIVAFAILAGYRRGALLLRWLDVDFENGWITVRRKGDVEQDTDKLPMSAGMREILERQRGHHPEWVFTYVAQRGHIHLRVSKETRKREKGTRHPITYEGLGSTMRRAVQHAGIENWRLVHDLRHTAATRTLRASGNLKAVQHMLAHKDLASTLVYAHVINDDVRNAMDSVSPIKVPTVGVREATAADFGLEKSADFCGSERV